MDELISREDRPPKTPTARIWTPPSTGEVSAVVLDAWKGYWVHWLGRRSMPCLTSNCPKPRHRRPIQWRGYLPISVWIRSPNGTYGWEAAIIGLSADNAKQLQPRLVELPGPCVKFCCVGNTKEVAMEILEGAKVPADLPEIPDVELTLSKVWGMRPPSQASYE